MDPYLEIELNGLYILLSDRQDLGYSFHWALYLAKSNTHGDVFHLINPSNPTTWHFETKSNDEVNQSREILLALKLGILEPVLHRALPERLDHLPIEYSTRFHESMSCRVWVKEALFMLEEEEFVDLVDSVDAIEAEASRLATRNKSRATRTVNVSGGSSNVW